MNFYSLFQNILALVLSVSTGDKKDKYVSGNNTDQAAALQFLQEYNQQLLKMANTAHKVFYNFNINITEANIQAAMKMSEVMADFEKEAWKNATSFAWKDFKDTNKTAYRMFKKLSILGIAALSEEKFEELHNLTLYMGDIYSTAKVCIYNAPSDEPCNLSLEPELEELFRSSRNYEELSHAWSEWRDVTGKIMKDKFIRYVELSNEAAQLNGFSDMGEMWREDYESQDFEEDVEELWKTIRPFYEQLHSYVRQKLRKQYPSSGIKADGPIPAHLLGNMWGEKWDNIFNIVSPYPGKAYTDVSETMKKKNITPLDMFKMSEEFFTSLGLIEMTPEFWNHSVIVKPKDREMVCHATAWDFYDGKDFAIKMCAEVNMEDFMVIHHEMGHIEYQLHYAKQPAIFRDGANSGIDEAIGDTIALSVSTPEHLKKLGLLEEIFDDEEADINTLLETALHKIAFIPYGYIVDAWRWKVFDGSISKENLNQKWWEMRLQYQGLCPPVRRTNEDFDPGAKFHVANDIGFIRLRMTSLAQKPFENLIKRLPNQALQKKPHEQLYVKLLMVLASICRHCRRFAIKVVGYFVAYVTQFQFHKALCDTAGHQGPLHKCNIYNSKKAGKSLSEMMSKGSSEHWEEAMSAITNGKSRKMDASAMIEYFAPLLDWLKEQNKNEILGWKSSDPMICP